MKHAVIAALSAVLFALGSCGGESQAASVAGKYSLDTKALEKMIMDGMGDMPAEQKAMMKPMMEGMIKAMGEMSVEVKADNTFVVSGGDQDAKGTWKLENGKVSMTTTEGKDKGETRVLEIKDGKLVGKDKGPDGKEMEITLIKK